MHHVAWSRQSRRLARGTVSRNRDIAANGWWSSESLGTHEPSTATPASEAIARAANGALPVSQKGGGRPKAKDHGR
jgi:hypothetical protein